MKTKTRRPVSEMPEIIPANQANCWDIVKNGKKVAIAYGEIPSYPLLRDVNSLIEEGVSIESFLNKEGERCVQPVKPEVPLMNTFEPLGFDAHNTLVFFYKRPITELEIGEDTYIQPLTDTIGEIIVFNTPIGYIQWESTYEEYLKLPQNTSVWTQWEDFLTHINQHGNLSPFYPYKGQTAKTSIRINNEVLHASRGLVLPQLCTLWVI